MNEKTQFKVYMCCQTSISYLKFYLFIEIDLIKITEEKDKSSNEARVLNVKVYWTG